MHSCSRRLWWLQLPLFLGATLACGGSELSIEVWSSEELGKIRSRIWDLDLPQDPTNRYANDPEAVEFGELLFYSTALSLDRTITCASCHDPAVGFADPAPLSQGLGVTKRHAPQLWNVGYQRWFYWDGRRDSLWSQALNPIEERSEMGLDRLNVLRRVRDDTTLNKAFTDIFGAFPNVLDLDLVAAAPEPDDPESDWSQGWLSLNETQQFELNSAFVFLGKALAAYEMTLVSGRSRFDRYASAVVAGDAKGQQFYTEEERLGLRLFIGKGRCFFCHTGPRFTDDEFHNLGLATIEDLGRLSAVEQVKDDPFNSGGAFSDAPDGVSAQFTSYLALSDEQAGQFKTGGLRDIASSPPYMHDGRFETLLDVVEFYSTLPGRVQVGHREDFMVPLLLDDEELNALVVFMESLSPEDR